MTDALRAAAQQALEAMNYTGMDVGKFNRINAACAALRAALAEPAGEPAHATDIADAARVIAWANESPRRSPSAAFTAGAERQAAYWIEWAERRKAQPAGEPEPVAWGFPNTAITGRNRWMMLREEVPADDQYGGALWVPLYVAPPQRKPLTYMQMSDIYVAWDRTPGTSWTDFVRAIERAHGIGGGE